MTSGVNAREDDEQNDDTGRMETWGTDPATEQESSVEALDQKLDTLIDAVDDAVAE